MRFEQDFKDILKHRLESGTVQTFDDEVKDTISRTVYGVFDVQQDYGTKKVLKYTLDLFKKPNDSGKIPDYVSSISVTTSQGTFVFNADSKKEKLVFSEKQWAEKTVKGEIVQTVEILSEYNVIYFPTLKKLEFWLTTYLPTKEENPDWGYLPDGTPTLEFTCEIHYYDKVQKYNIHAVNDLFFKAENFVKGDNDVIMVVQGGNVTKSNIPEYDLNTMPLIVNFVVPLIRKNEFMSFLGGVAEEYNGKLEEYNGWLRGDKDDVITQYRAIYNTPFVIGESQEIRCGTGTIKICTIQWIISLNYGKNAYIKTPRVFLWINDVPIEIFHVMRYEHAYAPAYDDYQKFGDKIRTAKKLSAIRTWVFQIAKINLSETSKSAVRDLLMPDPNYPKSFEDIMSDVTDKERLQVIFEAIEWGYEFDLPIKVQGEHNGDTNYFIKINHFSLSGGTENNSGSYLLTLEV